MSKPPTSLSTAPHEFSPREAPSQAGRRAPESSPQSTAQAQRGTVDSLIQASLVDLFQAYGIALAPMPRSLRERPPALPDVSAMIGFTTESRRTGRLTLSLPSAVIGLMKIETPNGFRQGDWARELTNQLMGRIKNRMLQFSVRLQAGLPANLEPKLLESQLQAAPANMRAYTGRTLRGEVVVTVEGMLDDAELKYVGPSRVASEGDTILF